MKWSSPVQGTILMFARKINKTILTNFSNPGRVLNWRPPKTNQTPLQSIFLSQYSWRTPHGMKTIPICTKKKISNG